MIQQQPYVWLQFRDDSESLATQQYHIRRGTQPTIAQQAASTLRGLLRPVSGCRIITQSYILPGIELATPDPLAGVIAQRHAVFVFSTTEPDQYAIIAVPGLRDDLLLQTGPFAGLAIDTTLPAVAAFVLELTNGSWVNKFGYTILTLEAAYLQVRDAVFVPDWLC